jgi:DmsE family decaheme c-type cytochrome
MKTKSQYYIFSWSTIILCFVVLAGNGCQPLKVSKPIIPMQEYEKMLVGRLDANYVGNDTCLAACHYHDKLRDNFEASTMGAQLSTQSGLPVVDCESCHGPGSIAIQGLTPEKVAQDKAKGIITACNYDSLLHLHDIPATAQSLLCLKCHSANATFNLHNWRVGSHATAEVSCFPCHNIHAGSDLITNPKDIATMCEQCHQRVKADFSLPSHHPVPENRVFCIDCHEPHGTLTDKQLRENSVKETCTRCHGEKEGPFIYEHAENTEDCLTCHNSHGSVNNNLLKVRQPYLCLQCHNGHRTTTGSTTKPIFYPRCTNCHTQIHGSDLPSVRTDGTFTH